MLPALALAFQMGVTTPMPDVVTRARLDTRRGVDFHALVVPETVYVGQQATYQLGVFVDQETRQRLRRNPEFLPPESRSMLSYDLPDRGTSGVVTLAGRQWEVHVFRRALFPLTPGTYPIPVARLSYVLPQSPSFFAREESFTLRSEAVSVVAVPLPTAGRPPDWSGAVGEWRASARVATTKARVGDALLVTVRVEGQGNVTLLPRPTLDVSWATVVPADERVQLDSTPTQLRGSKEFDYLVTPREAGAQTVPAVRLAYFDPRARRYETSVTAPIAVRVDGGDIVGSDSTAATAPAAVADGVPTDLPTIDAVIDGDQTPSPLQKLLAWLMLAMLPTLPTIAFGVILVRRPRRAKRARTAAERLLRTTEPTTPAAVRRDLILAIGDRTALDVTRITDSGAWEQALRREGVTVETAAEVRTCLDELGRAAFGPPGSSTPAHTLTRAREAYERIDSEARRRTGRSATARALVLLAVTVAAAQAQPQRGDRARAEQAYAEGAAAYAGADYRRAQARFDDAIRAADRSASAWAAYAAASWQAADTGAAVVGWQRALRLDPRRDDWRDRLARVRAPQESGYARVPAIPALLPTVLALFVWGVGWSLVIRQAWRRRPVAALIVVTALVGGGALWGAVRWEHIRSGRALVVIVDPVALRALPALGADAVSTPMKGEVAAVDERSGVWVHVVLDAGRAGWIPAERVTALGRD
jgi:hypothetical protein